jgi:dinuclear metal center YbgI/SA1388 family protein
MPSVASILAALAEHVPGDKAAEWDHEGLQVGDPDANVTLVGVCHEANNSVIDAAIARGVELLICYHPLLFRPVTRLTTGAGPAGRAWKLARAGIGLAAVHTSWDAARQGTADSLARTLGVLEPRGFSAMDGARGLKLVTFVPGDFADRVSQSMFAAGAGRIGQYGSCSFRIEGIGTFVPLAGSQPHIGRVNEMSTEPEVRIEVVLPANRRDAVLAALLSSHPYDEPAFDLYPTTSNLGFGGRIGTLPEPVGLAQFAKRVAAALGGPVRYAGADRTVSHVAVVPGAGGSMANEAAAAGADVFVTGDLSHHQTIAATEGGLAVIDAGHARTEMPGMRSLLEVVGRVVPDPIDLISDATPWEVAG